MKNYANFTARLYITSDITYKPDTVAESLI